MDEIVETNPNEYYVPRNDVFFMDALVVGYKEVVYKTNKEGLLELENGFTISHLNLRYFKKVDESYVGRVGNEIIKRKYGVITID